MNTTEAILPQHYYMYLDKEGVVDGWKLVNTPYPIFSILAVYLITVLYLGPRMMDSRPPFQLNGLMMLYNLFQIGFNTYLLNMVFSKSGVISYLYEHGCHPLDPNETFHIRYLLHVSTWYYLCSKIIDLLDTCFLVLRKKSSHVSYLHLYHHVGMVLCTWYSLKYVKAQQATPLILLNTFVHVVMYTYYFLACFGPKIQKYLWWKRYLTMMQLTQFAAAILYMTSQYINQCDIHHGFNVIWITNVAIIAAFFINFYIQTYILKSTKTSKKEH